MKENKAKIAISIDADLLRRLDGICDARGQNRSAIINRLLNENIKGEEKFVQDMESPVNRLVLKTFLNTPGLIETMAATLGESMSKEDVKKLHEGYAEQEKLGKSRQQSKKNKRRATT